VKAYREHQSDIHNGLILPIGKEPCGTGWTGFQSMKNDNSGYVLVFRELSPENKCAIKLWQPENKEINFKHVAGYGNSFKCSSTENGEVVFNLPQPFSFALYKYSL
jgi:hypothetical protein